MNYDNEEIFNAYCMKKIEHFASKKQKKSRLATI